MNRYTIAMTFGPLIDANALARELGRGDYIVVDCRFTLTDPPAGRAAYERGHIPGARYADLDNDLARHPRADEGRHPLPEPERFAVTLGDWGIGPDDAVVAYDEGSGAIAARLWWLLGWLGHPRRAVLDGGFNAWQEAGLPVEQALPSVRARRYEASLPKHADVVATEALAATQEAGGLLVDARAAPRYRGEQEPIDPKAGHVPGARNRPFSANVTPTGRFKSPAELRTELTELLGGRNPDRLIAMCGSGVTASHLLLAMDVAGLPGGRLYAGSWSEWIRDPSRPVRTGAEP
ncbi:MAG TPA: sulfurtransferase [Rhodanobacteraceae bacterium]|nr:sulfurtransferase [Rhodanobacteraceae bacterium]